MNFYFAYLLKFFSRHLTFSLGGMAKLTVQFVIKTASSKRSSQTVRVFMILSHFLNVRMMWEEYGNLASALEINLSLIIICRRLQIHHCLALPNCWF